MNKQEVVSLLNTQHDRLNEFAVKALFLFGSVARDEATEESDVDFLVEFDRPVGLFTLLGLQAFLEELLGCSVDVGTPSSLRSHMRETGLKESIRVV
jgi:predicted nucleotidyltransferase